MLMIIIMSFMCVNCTGMNWKICLQGTFPHILWYGQKLLFHSAIWPENQAVASAEYLMDDGSRISIASSPSIEPMYYLAVCSRNPASLPATLNKISLFGDTSESVYQDYVKQTRQAIKLDRLLINCEQLVAERDELLTLRTQQMEERERLIAERDEMLALRTQQMEERDTLLGQRAKQLNESTSQIAAQGLQIEAKERQVDMLNQQLAERTSFMWLLKLPWLLLQRVFKAKDKQS